jgi:serine/threonine-protein kinase
MRSRPEPVKAPVEGEVLCDRYRLQRLIARGGMSEVWLATHLALRSDVAIKFLRTDGASTSAASALERFRFEAQVSATLSRRTAHVVQVLDAGPSPLGPFLAMELVVGRTLRQHLRAEGRLAPEALRDLLEPLCEALAAAHALGIVHRDVKPSNVMLTRREDGSIDVKLADFGVAKATRQTSLDSPPPTVVNAVLGTPAYMAPEQVRCEALDARADVWAVAALAYEALTGRPPFQAETTIELMAAIASSPHAPPSAVWPALAPLDAWFQCALAKRPADRFPSMAALLAGFDAALFHATSAHLNGVRIAAHVPTLPPLTARSATHDQLAPAPTRRSQRVQIVGVVLLLGLVLFIAAFAVAHYLIARAGAL